MSAFIEEGCVRDRSRVRVARRRGATVLGPWPRWQLVVSVVTGAGCPARPCGLNGVAPGSLYTFYVKDAGLALEEWPDGQRHTSTVPVICIIIGRPGQIICISWVAIDLQLQVTYGGPVKSCSISITTVSTGNDTNCQWQAESSHDRKLLLSR